MHASLVQEKPFQVDPGWEYSERSTNSEETEVTGQRWRRLGVLPAGWLVSTFQVSGTPELYLYKPNNIITSILPRQEERREKQRKRECVCPWD
jgi:hypothetical protein